MGFRTYLYHSCLVNSLSPYSLYYSDVRNNFSDPPQSALTATSPMIQYLILSNSACFVTGGAGYIGEPIVLIVSLMLIFFSRLPCSLLPTEDETIKGHYNR